MSKRELSTNFAKHTSKNPIQRLLIKHFYSEFISMIEPLKPNKILDAGCGEGFSLNKLKENNIGKKLEGLEYSKTAINLGEKVFPQINIKRGSVYDIPYKRDSFDIVVCTEVLEHLEDTKKALSEIMRVSRKYAIFSVPNEPFFMLSNLLRGKNLKRFGNDEGHLNHWTIYSFQKLLNKNGFKIKKLKLPFPWILVLAEKK